MNCYAGNMLFVDLTKRSVTVEPLREEWLDDYWGCWGLALRYYWEEVTPQVAPLAPENALVLMTGTLGGTLVPLTGRMCLVSKSPQTGTVFQSNVGGGFANELKLAGYDGIVIRGRASAPVYLKIDNARVSLEDATALWGTGIFEADRRLKTEAASGEAKTLAIGQAGENLVRFSCIGSEAYRQLGRSGGGALFGSKNLKGIVCSGNGGIQVAEMATFLKTIDHHKTTSLLSEENLWAFTDGTPILMEATNEMGIHPTRNFTAGVNQEVAPLASDAMKKAKLGDRACISCPLACGKFTDVNGAQMEGPEYETLNMGGSNCSVNDLEQVILFNRLCDDLGMDTISCGSILGMAMEMTEKGVCDFGLPFGPSRDYLEVVTEIATLSSDRGRQLAQGAKALAEQYQCEELSTQIKGMELPAYDPRGNYGMGLSYATSERGACHMRAFTVFSETPFDLEGQAREVAEGQDLNAVKWSLGFCDVWANLTPEIMADLLSAGIGRTVTAAELLRSGERIWNLTRLFNLRAGFTAADDNLPSKLHKQRHGQGPNADRVFKKEDFELARASYYRLRGWDSDGVPSAAKLAELGLDQF